MTGDDFEAWARSTAQHAAAVVLARLTDAGVPAELGGEGGPKSTARGYRSHYVYLATSRLGRVAVWLYVVPAGHEYGTSPREAQLGGGLMYDSDKPLEKDLLAHGRLGAGNPFRWQTLKGEWQGYVLLLDTDPSLQSKAEGERLARAAFRGLGRAGLDR